MRWYVDDTTPNSCTDDIPNVIKQLQSTASELFSWFTNNHTKVNPDNCHSIKHTKSNWCAS